MRCGLRSPNPLVVGWTRGHSSSKSHERDAPTFRTTPYRYQENQFSTNTRNSHSVRPEHVQLDRPWGSPPSCTRPTSSRPTEPVRLRSRSCGDGHQPAPAGSWRSSQWRRLRSPSARTARRPRDGRRPARRAPGPHPRAMGGAYIKVVQAAARLTSARSADTPARAPYRPRP
jgi:hypothetical protein